jgi:hypothetical protein
MRTLSNIRFVIVTQTVLLAIFAGPAAYAQGNPVVPGSASDRGEAAPTAKPTPPPPAALEKSPTREPARRKLTKERPRVRHTPLASARNQGRDLAIEAHLEREWLLERATLHVRRLGERKFREVVFLKSPAGMYVALVPEATVNAPGFEYYIETKTKKGETQQSFASANDPQRVVVRNHSSAERFERRLARHAGTRHEFSLGFKYVNTGTQDLTTLGGGATPGSYRDSFNQLDLGYTHRILSDYIYGIHFGFGIVGAKLGMSRPLEQAGIAPRTGVYFGRARATWEFLDLVGLDLSVILGANQIGFVVGGGGTLRLGRVTGTHLDIGVEYIQTTGYDAWLELTWDTVPGFLMSLRADLTTWPSSQDGMAVIPSFNVKWMLPRNFFATASIGYGTRFRYQHGGVSFATGMGYAF